MAQWLKALSAVPDTPDLDPQDPQTHTVSRCCSRMPRVCPMGATAMFTALCCTCPSSAGPSSQLSRLITGPYTVLAVLATASGIFWETWDMGLCIKVDDSKGPSRVENPVGIALQHVWCQKTVLLYSGEIWVSHDRQCLVDPEWPIWKDKSAYEHDV